MRVIVCIIAMTLIVVVSVYAFVYYTKVLKKWKTLDTQVHATVISVVDRVYRTRNRRYVHEYKYKYDYECAGTVYSGETDWLDLEYSVGDSIPVKLKEGNPAVAVSNMDHNNSWEGAIVSAFGAIFGSIVLLVMILNAYYG